MVPERYENRRIFGVNLGALRNFWPVRLDLANRGAELIYQQAERLVVIWWWPPNGWAQPSLASSHQPNRLRPCVASRHTFILQ